MGQAILGNHGYLLNNRSNETLSSLSPRAISNMALNPDSPNAAHSACRLAIR
jgi:hypothetical protein